jgi:hypothetical protein
MTMTYGSLFDQIKSYLNRSDQDTLNQIPNFISQASDRICRDSENVGFQIYVTGALIATQYVIPKPVRWRRNLTFSIGTGNGYNTREQLLLRRYEFIRDYWPDPTQTATPKFYGDYGYSNLIIAPVPDLPYPFEWSYLELPEPLGPTVSTNWLTNYAPDVLLIASLVEAMPYLKNSEKIPEWNQFYLQRIASLNKQDIQRKSDRGGSGVENEG